MLGNVASFVQLCPKNQENESTLEAFKQSDIEMRQVPIQVLLCSMSLIKSGNCSVPQLSKASRDYILILL